ncbi:uncharacterized protein LOC134745886 isoform X2 [Cydia strobilella]|uniref:uncharacterized protein LOC134745886 isoform X2 n=1 Tax=Cydia strobilella TaxID=1100964 RepID=UPI0030057582
MTGIKSISKRLVPTGDPHSLARSPRQCSPVSRRRRSTMRLLTLSLLVALALGDLSPVDHIRDNFYKLEKELWANATNPDWINAGLGADIEVTKTFSSFHDRFSAVPMPPRPQVDSWPWVKATEKLGVVDNLYKNFMEFVKRQAVPGAVPSPVREWLDLAEVILRDPKLSVADAVQRLDELIEHGDMFRSTLQEQSQDLCELQMSPHQLIYDMYNTIALTEIKGYAMMQFSWILLKIYGKGNYTEEASLTRQRYAERTEKTAAAAKAALAMSKRGVYRCDPAQHKEGETFAQVTRLLQGYIENEVDMNTDGTCRDNCAYYSLAERKGCFKELYCAKQRPCNGRILNCQYIDSDMWVCPAGRNSNRRYEWIEYENGRTLGRAGQCTLGTTKVDSWWRWNLQHCSYCMCLCEDPAPEAERVFSLREAVTDLQKNKVVTGLRIAKVGRVFHLQISEGVLGERGAVTPSGWVPVVKFDPADVGVAETDYHTLTYEQRAIDLDELDSPKGHVLTGVRWRMIGAHLHFEIRSTPFNYTTGRLAPDRSQWISNDNTEGAEQPRKRLELYKPDVPTRSAAPMPVDSTHDQYVEFVNSDFEADAAQTTVPFLDVQPVEPMKGASLASGAGVVHRGSRGSGGFVSVKLFTYDYSPHVRADPPPQHEPDFVPLPVIN